MPHYVFRCLDCSKGFPLVLRITDLERINVDCPHCGGKRVTQEVAEFTAVTSKKS